MTLFAINKKFVFNKYENISHIITYELVHISCEFVLLKVFFISWPLLYLTFARSDQKEKGYTSRKNDKLVTLNM
jgi:hypothetical protein